MHTRATAYICYYLRSRLRYHAYNVLPPLSRQSIISSALCAALPRYMAKVLPAYTNVLVRHGDSKFSRIADWIPLEFIKAYHKGNPSILSPEMVMIVSEISTGASPRRRLSILDFSSRAELKRRGIRQVPRNFVA